jgi:glycosyltransferase involved in cell wall biosynthesis
MPQNFEHYFKIPSVLKAIYTRFVWNWVFEMYRKLPLIVSPTQSGADELSKNGFKGKIEVVSCGVDCSLFEQKENPEVLRKLYELPNVPIVLYTGRLDKEKNIDTILKACALVIKNIHFHLVITGTGKDETKLKLLAKSLGINQHVTFTGKIADDKFTSIYSLASVFVNACNYELQCISALEALAAGLPVILANSLALPELVNNVERNGFTFTPNDHAELAEILKRVLIDTELREQLSENSKKLSEKHDIQKTALNYISIYTNLINSYNL